MNRVSRVVLLLTFLYASFQPASSQDTDCHYVCPANDLRGHLLFPGLSEGFPYDTSYSIFECVYAMPELAKDFKCHYFKESGEHALGSKGSLCPGRADQYCPVPGSAPPPKVTPEALSWVDRASWLLWQKAHP